MARSSIPAATRPGLTQVTLIRYGANERARFRVKATTAALDTQYVSRSGNGSSASMEPMLTIRPGKPSWLQYRAAR